MYSGNTIALLIPARNEAPALPAVLNTIPPLVDSVVVIDNGSTDATARVAHSHGAQVVSESNPGYGMACLAGMETLKKNPPDIVAFADADGSDDLSRLPELIAPLVKGQADLVIERRVPVEPDALSQQQRFGNWLATTLIRLFWGHTFQDLGPMRGMRWEPLQNLNMKDQDFGWTIEMQIKAVKTGLRIIEVPLPYMKRSAGTSKISRTIKGAIKAGIKIIWVIFREALMRKEPVQSKNKESVSKVSESHLPSN